MNGDGLTNPQWVLRTVVRTAQALQEAAFFLIHEMEKVMKERPEGKWCEDTCMQQRALEWTPNLNPRHCTRTHGEEGSH